MRGKKFCQLAPPGEREENVLVKTVENISAKRDHPSRGLRQPRRRSTLLATVTQVVWSWDTESETYQTYKEEFPLTIPTLGHVTTFFSDFFS